MPSGGLAQRYAVRRARWGLASLVAACMLSACHADSAAQGAAPHPSGRSSAVPISRQDLPRPAAAGTNRRLARGAAARMLVRFPVPTGATRADAPQSRRSYLGQLREFYGPVDKSLTLTRWWIVPLGYHRLVDWYVARTPADRRSTQYDNGRTATQAILAWGTHGPATAYSPPAMVLTYSRLTRDSTAIRTDVTLAARDDRTAPTLVPATVTSIAITRQALDGPDASPTTVTTSDQGDLNAVVAAFDRVPGQYRSAEEFGCGSPVGIMYLYAVAFRWAHHTLVVDSGQPLCDVGRKLTRDGIVVHQRLDPESPLDAVLKAIYDRQ